MEDQFVFTDRKLGFGQNLAVGAPVVVGDQRAQVGAGVALNAVERDFQPFGRAAAACVQHMCCQISGHIDPFVVIRAVIASVFHTNPAIIQRQVTEKSFRKNAKVTRIIPV